jgi:hypothetical protein
VALAKESGDAALLMARNAGMERQIMGGSAPDPEGWTESPEGLRWTKVLASLEDAHRTLKLLQRAAGFNPKRPLNAGA